MAGKKSVGWALLAILLGLVACGGPKPGTVEADPTEPQTTQAPDTARYARQTLQLMASGCTEPRDCPAVFTAVWPVFEADSALNADALNCAAEEMASACLGWNVVPLADIGREFMDMYQTARAETAWQGPHEAQCTLRVAMDSLGLVTLWAQGYLYQGGAHGQQLSFIKTYTKSTGLPLNWPEIWQPGYEPKLRALGLKYFLAARALPPSAQPDESGLAYEGLPPENMAFVPEGLAVQFNAYDIGPYALGPTFFIIPWAEVLPLLQPSALTGPPRMQPT